MRSAWSLSAFSSEGLRYYRLNAVSLLDGLLWTRCQKVDTGTSYNSALMAYVLFSAEFVRAARAVTERSAIPAMHVANRRKRRLVRLQKMGEHSTTQAFNAILRILNLGQWRGEVYNLVKTRLRSGKINPLWDWYWKLKNVPSRLIQHEVIVSKT